MEDFDRYVAAAWPRLLRSAWLLTGDWYLAEDLLQTALTKTYTRWRRVRSGSADAYVRKVLATTYVSWWRRRWRAETPTAEPPEQPVADTSSTNTDLRIALERVLRRLPTGQRTVLMLRFHGDLTEAATATVLGVSVGTVKSQTARALTALRAEQGLRDLLAMEAT
ncbi:SigE family RNA polymerase sigma factor [Amycolatopsis sp. cmx-4-68]|uniref:SigE family RNA polymerase sigma factor n=1 Tax=Amycolatopsis sp. cmx-4-68 TaxID=2790938 RepID=UPI00397D053A